MSTTRPQPGNSGTAGNSGNSATHGARARYGTGKASATKGSLSGKLIAIFMLVMLVAIVIAFAKYLGSTANKTINGQVANVEVIDDSTFQLTFDISRKDTERDYYCIVTALNYDMAEVGRRELIIPAGGVADERYSTQIHTRESAVSGNVYGCSENIPFYLDVPTR